MKENSLELASKGLKQVFLSQVLSIIAMVCLLIVAIASVGVLGSALSGSAAGTAGAMGVLAIFGLGAGVLSIISLVFYLMGLSKAGSAHPGFKTALILVVVNLVLAVINTFAGATVIGTVITIVTPIINFLTVSYVCNSSAELLRSVGDEVTALRGGTVRMIYLVCMVVGFACSILAVVPALAMAASVIGIVSSIASLVGLVIYMGFLKKSSESLAAAPVQ